nr:carbohydrate-binding family 9-like protein [Paenibacillus sp. ACRRX]
MTINRSNVPEPAIGDYCPQHYICKRAREPLVLDGRLDKSFWETADWTSDFVDIEGDLKPLPTKRTRLKMLWDDQYFYFGAEMEEEQIWATLTERDSVIFHDNDFEIFIDPDGDTHNYYEFEINALNTVWDLLLPKPYRDGGPPINGWDIKGLQTAVHIDGELNNPHAANRKWSVEVAMPWSSLKECAAEGRMPRNGEYWRVNFSRVEWHVDVVEGQYVKRRHLDSGRALSEENWVWSPMGIVNMHYPELWGYVLFTEDADASFELPDDELSKWQLRKIYYRQRDYYERYGRFCEDLLTLQQDEQWFESGTFKLSTTGGLFEASVPSTDGRTRLYIREDGKTWRE